MSSFRSLLKHRLPPRRFFWSSRTLSPNFRFSSGPLILYGLASGFAGYFLARNSLSPKELEFGVYGSYKDIQSGIRELEDTFRNSAVEVSTDPDDLTAHGSSENDYHESSSHSVVVYPECTEDVVKIVKIATKYRLPIVAYGGASSLEGQFRATQPGSICVDLANMSKILEIHEADMDLICQPGIGWVEINETLKEKGIPLFFPIDPASTASIGGMISNGCSGTNAVRYGTARGEWFLNATVVLPSGEVIKTRRRSRKSSAGFDLTKLFIGAEGTLGIITEVTIRLTPVLPTTVAAVHFPDVKMATEAVKDVMKYGVGIQCVELMDSNFMKATNMYGQSQRKWPEKDTLFFKLQGPVDPKSTSSNKLSPSLQQTVDIVRQVCLEHSGTGWTLASNAQEAEDMWTDRKNALYSGLALVEGSRGWSTDVCVPVSNLPTLVLETQKDLEQTGLVSTIVGHVGDGNFHALILFKTDDELETARHAVHRMVKRALRLDGTSTGEHGIGKGKKEFLEEELGGNTVQLMRRIKQLIDPLGLFNPGKLYPDDEGK